MATEVELKIVANGTQAAAEINKVNTALKGTQAQSDKTTTAVKAQATAQMSLIGAYKGVLTAMAAASAAALVIYGVYKQTIGVALRYADQVRTLSQVTNQSAQETSKLIQVTDDFKVSEEALTMASRTLARQGLSLNIDTLAELSDKFKTLNTGQEKAKFLMDNFGRSGVQFAEIMSQGSAAIKAQGASIEKGLILDQKALVAARKLEMQQDALNDAWMAAKVAVGNALIPALSKAATGYQATLQAEAQAHAEGVKAGKAFYDRVKVIREGILAQQAWNDVLRFGVTTDVDFLTALDGTNKGLDNQTRAYTLMAAKIGATSAATEELTQDFQAQAKAADDLFGAYKDGSKSAVDALHRMAIAQLESKATTEDQFEAINKLKIAWGLASAETIGDAKAIEYMTQQVLEGKMSIDQLQAAIDRMHGKTITITLVTNQKNVYGGGGGGTTTTTPSGLHVPRTTEQRAAGGPLGNATLVGEAGPEAIINGWVYNAAQTRDMLRSGKLAGARRFAAGGLGYGDDPLTIGLSPRNAAYNQAYYAPYLSGSSRKGKTSAETVANAAMTTTVSAQRTAAAATSTAQLVQATQLAQAVAAKTMVDELRALRRDIPRAIRDAIQTVV